MKHQAVWLHSTCRSWLQDKICAQLDGALLSDDEMAKYGAKWASLPDPPHARAGNGTMQQ